MNKKQAIKLIREAQRGWKKISFKKILKEMECYQEKVDEEKMEVYRIWK